MTIDFKNLHVLGGCIQSDRTS